MVPPPPGPSRDAATPPADGRWRPRPCPRITSANVGELMGCGEIMKAAATVPASDSYPHVTCG